MSKNTTPQNVTNLPKDETAEPQPEASKTPFYKNEKVWKIGGIAISGLAVFLTGYSCGRMVGDQPTDEELDEMLIEMDVIDDNLDTDDTE